MPPQNVPLPNSNPASLPPMQAPAPFAPAPAPQATTAEQASLAPKQAAIAQAKQLVEQYRGNPYQLNLALQQVKQQYLTSQFNINPNQSQK